jgi:hypothetical protein
MVVGTIRFVGSNESSVFLSAASSRIVSVVLGILLLPPLAVPSAYTHFAFSYRIEVMPKVIASPAVVVVS